MFPQGQHTEAGVQRQPNLVMWKSLLGGTIYGLWRAVEAWVYERPGEATGECEASVEVETAEFEGVIERS